MRSYQASTPSQLLSSVVDFNRNRSTESTERVDQTATSGVKRPHPSSSSSMSVASETGSYVSAEGRSVTMSPKKMPPTPPRDSVVGVSPVSSDPDRHIPHAFDAKGLRQPVLFSATSFSSSSSSSSSGGSGTQSWPTFIPRTPSSISWRTNGDERRGLSSIFRSPPRLSFDSVPDYCTIQRCSAFDEGDEGDELCYSDDDSTGGIAEF